MILPTDGISPSNSMMLPQCRQRLEFFLFNLLSGRAGFPKLYEAMRYSVLNGGKRVRASFVYLVGSHLQLPLSVLDVIAASVEMIHAFSLIHDDLPGMDDDDMRRGKPSCHIAFGEDLAILAGDALHTEAFCLLARAPELQIILPEHRLRLIECLSMAVGAEGMVSGQAMDMAFQRQDVVIDSLIQCHQLKTGNLLRASILLPVIAAGIAEQDEYYQDYYRVGDLIGLAFQIQDDILDQIGTTEELGKTAGKDQMQKKATFPRLIGLDASYQKIRSLQESSIVLLKKLSCSSPECLAFIQTLVGRTS